MFFVTSIGPDVFGSAGLAYVHYFSFMLCFAALVLERKLLKVDLNRNDVIALVVTDVVYGLAALSLLISGILRVLYFGQGAEFYTQNPLFWTKVGIFLAVGGLSLYPTITYILWLIPLRRGDLPIINKKIFQRLAISINIEILGFALIPLLATFMSRGVGLVD